MNIRMPLFVNTDQLSIQYCYLSTQRILKTLRTQSEAESEEYKSYDTAYVYSVQLNDADVKGLDYISMRQHIVDTLKKRLQSTPREEIYRLQIQKIENSLLLFEQCSPFKRGCLITNEFIPVDNKIPQFVFINQYGISQSGMFKLMKARKKYEDSEEGLRHALEEVVDLQFKDKIKEISERDIVRLRLYIEELNFFPPTFKGMMCGFVLGGLNTVGILRFLTLEQKINAEKK